MESEIDVGKGVEEEPFEAQVAAGEIEDEWRMAVGAAVRSGPTELRQELGRMIPALPRRAARCGE